MQENPPLIYILDDEPSVVTSISKNIAVRRPALIRPFHTAADLLKSKDLAQVDLFILDIKLGDDTMTGFDIPAHLPAACRFAAYLFISGYPIRDADFNQAAALPFFDFVQKPFGMIKFVHRLELLLAARLKAPAEDDSLAQLGELPPFVAAVLDRRLFIRQCNTQFAALLQIKQADVIGRNFVEFLPSELADHLVKKGGRIDLTEKGEFHAPVTTTTGTIERVMWYNSPFAGEKGRELTLIVGIPGTQRLKIVGRLRRQWQQAIIKDRAAIRAIRKISVPDWAGRHLDQPPECRQ